MKKILFSLIILAFAGNVSAQTGENVKKPSIALKVSAFDFTTARAIQVNTLGSVLNNKSWEKLSNSTKSIGVQYFKGVTPKYTDLARSIVKVNIRSTSGHEMICYFKSGRMAHRPSKGPKPNQGSRLAKSCEVARLVKSSMLTIEMPKPMQLVKVNTLPTA